MDVFIYINIITLLMACIFIAPILAGIIRPLTDSRIHDSFSSLLNNIIFLASVILSFYISRIILSGNENFDLTNLYRLIPALKNVFSGKEIWGYLIFLILLVLIIYGTLYLITFPLYRFVVVPASKKLSSKISSMSSCLKRVIGGFWQIPKSIWLVLIFSILLNFYTDLFNRSVITEYANNSIPYQLIQENVIQPLMNNSVVKNIQILLNESFKSAENEISNASNKVQLVKYINGMTLDEAVKSNFEIDSTAKKVAGSKKDDKEKAYLIYKWVSKNIKYDNSKAVLIAVNPSKVSSGAIVAYKTRTGICFDYACLYVAMCRAVGLKVKFLTGLGYSGTAWGDHAWKRSITRKKTVGWTLMRPLGTRVSIIITGRLSV